jgi:serine/threonine-protein kinase HipA
VLGTPRLAPAYDLVTTAAYLPGDRMALTLDGRPDWPDARRLDALGTTRCGLSPAAASIRERVAEALSETMAEMADYAADHPEFADIADRMAGCWEEGIRASLGHEARHSIPATPKP